MKCEMCGAEASVNYNGAWLCSGHYEMWRTREQDGAQLGDALKHIRETEDKPDDQKTD